MFLKQAMDLCYDKRKVGYCRLALKELFIWCYSKVVNLLNGNRLIIMFLHEFK